MKRQEMTLQQLKEIVDGAPEGAEYYDPSINGYLRCAGFDAIKLSDIRAELKARPKFKVGDLVVLNTGRKIYRVDHIYRTVVWLDSGKESCDVVDIRDVLRHATAEEEAAGHRIDEPLISDEMASPCAVSDSAKDQAQMDLQNNESEPCNHVPFDLGHDDDQGNRDCLRCGKTLSAIEVDRLWRGYANTVTTQLDNEAALFNEPLTECELVADPVNHPSHYTSDPSGIECIQITRHRNFNISNAIKYLWRAGLKDQAATIQDLQKAIWYINDEIARLEGEQGE